MKKININLNPRPYSIFIENNTNEEHTVKRKSFRDIDDRLVIPKESGGDHSALQIHAQNALDQLKGFTSIEKSQEPFEIVDFNSNQINMNVTATEDGYVFYGDGFHKHWKSFVDGEKQPIYKTNIKKYLYFTKLWEFYIGIVRLLCQKKVLMEELINLQICMFYLTKC